jgi:hypothetical protein
VDWILLPTFWVVANGIEWAFHRYPMHRPMPPRLLYKNHAQLHHLAFTEQTMPVTETRELGLVMMPWYTMIGLFILASPVFIAAGLVRGVGLRPGGLFFRLRAHHARHHVLRRMAHTNFNVTVPLMDWLLRTRE